MPELTLSQAKEMETNKVKKLYLSVVAVIIRSVAKVMTAMESATSLRVDGIKSELLTAIKFAVVHYGSTMQIFDATDKVPPYFLIGRNIEVKPDGDTRKTSENNATVNDRFRIGEKGSKQYGYRPNGFTIHGIDAKDVGGKIVTVWEVRDAKGKKLTVARVLNAEAYPYCEDAYRRSLIGK